MVFLVKNANGVATRIHHGVIPPEDIQPGEHVEMVDAMPEPTVEDLKADAIAQIRLQAGQIILGRYPLHLQMNAGARAVELVATGQASGPEWDGIGAVWTWIKAVRAESNRVEADILRRRSEGGIREAVAGAVWPA